MLAVLSSERESMMRAVKSVIIAASHNSTAGLLDDQQHFILYWVFPVVDFGFSSKHSWSLKSIGSCVNPASVYSDNAGYASSGWSPCHAAT